MYLFFLLLNWSKLYSDPPDIVGKKREERKKEKKEEEAKYDG
jgi:hypothetical protein